MNVMRFVNVAGKLRYISVFISLMRKRHENKRYNSYIFSRVLDGIKVHKCIIYKAFEYIKNTVKYVVVKILLN